MTNDSSKDNPDEDYTRRDFLKSTGLAAGLAGGLALANNVLAAENAAPPSSDKLLPLKVTGYDFDRLAALASGKVEIRGCNTQFTVGKIGDMNTDVFSGAQTFDVTEIGLHPFMLAYANDNFRDYTLLPIFPLRVFRHKSVFIRRDAGITKPEDLRGRRIATPGYSSTSLTYMRGIFQDEYGISPQEINWVTAVKDSSAEAAGKISKQEGVVPKDISMEFGTPGKDESELLVDGEVDAVFHAAEPKAYVQGNPNIGRLFSNSKAVEQAFYKKTGIFPIMHSVAIRKSLLEENPWLAQAVFDAYSQAKQMAYQQMNKVGWAMSSLPWYGQELEETKRLMGPNFYSYGLDVKNSKTLETLFKYSHQQGLASRQLTIKDLFAAQSLNFVE